MKTADKQEIARHVAGITICTIILALLSITAIGCGYGSRAEEQARIWCDKVGARSVSGISCVGRDTDDDGYISCTIAYENGTHEQIECAYGWLPWDSGCREPKAQIRTTTERKL